MKLDEIEVCNFKVDKTKITVEHLSNIQKEYVAKIEDYKAKHCKVPSVRTACKLLGLNSSGSVCEMLNRLILKGYDYRILSYDVKNDD